MLGANISYIKISTLGFGVKDPEHDFKQIMDLSLVACSTSILLCLQLQESLLTSASSPPHIHLTVCSRMWMNGMAQCTSAGTRTDSISF